MGDLNENTAVDGADGRYRATLRDDWRIWGPMGGYGASVALRAAAEVSDGLAPASFTCQFLSTARSARDPRRAVVAGWRDPSGRGASSSRRRSRHRRRGLGWPSRRYESRRATIDAMVDAHQPALRPLLERALRDSDAWTRWKALRGLVELGVEPSRAAVAPLAEDPDFRVRLEAARALRAPRGD